MKCRPKPAKQVWFGQPLKRNRSALLNIVAMVSRSAGLEGVRHQFELGRDAELTAPTASSTANVQPKSKLGQENWNCNQNQAVRVEFTGQVGRHSVVTTRRDDP